QLKDCSTFQLALGKLEWFPSLKHPTVITLEAGPLDTLTELANRIAEGMRAIYYPISHEKFRGHLTLGRLRYPMRQTFSLDRIILPPLPPIEITEIGLFESKTGEKQQIYTLLSHFNLSFC